MGPPCQLQAIVKNEECLAQPNRLSSLQLMFSVGGYVPTILFQTLKTAQPQCSFITTYGTTETSGGISATMRRFFSDIFILSSYDSYDFI